MTTARDNKAYCWRIGGYVEGVPCPECGNKSGHQEARDNKEIAREIVAQTVCPIGSEDCEGENPACGEAVTLIAAAIDAAEARERELHENVVSVARAVSANHYEHCEYNDDPDECDCGAIDMQEALQELDRARGRQGRRNEMTNTKKIDDGGPAFARPFSNHATATRYENFPAHDGMTLLDHFAAKAMQTMLVSPYYQDEKYAKIAEHAYVAADAMIAERNRRGVK